MLKVQLIRRMSASKGFVIKGASKPILNLAGCFLAVFALALLPAAAWAQDDEIIILDEEDAAPASPYDDYLEFIERYVFGRAGGLGFFASDGGTQFWAAQLGVDYPYDEGPFPLRGVAEVIYASRQAEIVQEREACNGNTRCEEERGNDPDEYGEKERTLEIEEQNLDVRQLYIEAEPLPDLVITAGRFSPIWGQFDVLSPVNLLLPIETQSNTFGISKESYRMPQDTVAVRWFPNERVELQAWYFPFIRLDPLYREVLLSPNNFGDGDSTDEERAGLRDLAKDEIDSYDAYAARALYYGDAFTAGLTFYQGYQSTAFFERADLDAPIGADICKNSNQTCEKVGAPDLPEMTAIGVEVSVPVGRWNLRAEAVYFEADLELLCCNYDRENNLMRMEAHDAYYQWIRNNNDDHLYVETPQVLAAFGFDANFDDWAFGLAIFVTTPLLSGDSKDANDLEEMAFPDSDSQLDLAGAFPNLYAIYQLDEEGEHQIGAAGGFLGPSAGVSLFL